VIAADRMASGACPLMLESPVNQPKILELTRSSAIAIAGNGALAHVFADNVVGLLKNVDHSSWSSRYLAEQLAEQYVIQRRVAMAAAVFGVRGITIEGLYGGTNKDMQLTLAAQLDSEAKAYELGFDFLMASVDASGAHLNGIGNPGKAYFYDSEGMAVIGQGHPVARLSMVEFGQTPDIGLAETAFHAYASVRRAEAVLGVGMGVDLWMLTKDGPAEFSSGALQTLSTIYDRARTRISETVADGLSEADLFGSKQAIKGTPIGEVEQRAQKPAIPSSADE